MSDYPQAWIETAAQALHASDPESDEYENAGMLGRDLVTIMSAACYAGDHTGPCLGSCGCPHHAAAVLRTDGPVQYDGQVLSIDPSTVTWIKGAPLDRASEPTEGTP